MEKTFTLNGKQHRHIDIDFDKFCEFEESGISLTNMQDKMISFIRLYVSMCMKAENKRATAKDAAKEIKAHFANGGTMEDITDIFLYVVENSSFFQALQRTDAQEEDAEG